MIVVVPGEKRLIDAMANLGIPYEIEPMDIGDIQIRVDKKNDDGENTSVVELIIERKEGKDLSSSILDGRYEEQKSRIMSLLDSKGLSTKCIYYLVENFPFPDGRYAYGEAARTRMWSAITNTCYRDGFNVFQSKDINESAEFLNSLNNSVMKYHGKEATKHEIKVSETALKKKKVSPDNFFMHSLMLIKGMQEDAAGAIVKVYPTYFELFKKYRTMIKNDENPERLLADIVRLSGKRKVGPAMSKKVYSFFEPEFFE